MAVWEALGQAEGGAHSRRWLVAVQGEPQGYRLCGRKRNKSGGGADARPVLGSILPPQEQGQSPPSEPPEG